MLIPVQSKPTKPLLRYHLNTGEVTTENLGRLAPLAIAPLRSFIESGGGSIRGVPGIIVNIDRMLGAAVFTFLRGEQPIETYAVAWTEAGADQAWAAIEELYLSVTDIATFRGANAEPVKPDVLPWLGVMTFPLLAGKELQDLDAVRKFALWLAAALLPDDLD